MNLTEIKDLIPECCNIAEIDIDKCYDNEIKNLKEFLPSVKSILVLAHHIEDSKEWVWNQLKSETETCTADLHTKNVIEKIKNYIELEGYNSKIIPYPGASGVRFKKLAAKTRVGEIGDNYLFLHHDWGPWVHLRVLITETKISSSQKMNIDNVCIHCGKCIEACPVNAINQNNFNRQKCIDRHDKLNLSHSCEICARICPIGEKPKDS